MPDELADALRKMPLLQEPAPVEGVHLDPDEPRCVSDVVEPRGRNQVRGFVGLEDSSNFLGLSSDPLRVRDAIGQAGKKFAGEVLSGWLVFGHRTTR
jgi:hypothetical protein